MMRIIKSQRINLILPFTTQDAAQDALNNFCAGDQDVVGKVKYQSISVKDFMEI